MTLKVLVCLIEMDKDAFFEDDSEEGDPAKQFSKYYPINRKSGNPMTRRIRVAFSEGKWTISDCEEKRSGRNLMRLLKHFLKH